MFKYQRVAAVGLIAGVVLASPGCGQLRRVQSAMSSGQSATSSDITQWTVDKLTKAFAAIDAKIGAHPADYVMIVIREHGVYVRAIDPKKRENVDEYTYEGGDVEVKPVDVSISEPGEVEQSKFGSDTVNPAVLVQVINSAVKDSGVENGTFNTVRYERLQADDPEPTISAWVGSPRTSKTVEYDVQGHLLKVD